MLHLTAHKNQPLLFKQPALSMERRWTSTGKVLMMDRTESVEAKVPPRSPGHTGIRFVVQWKHVLVPQLSGQGKASLAKCSI